MNSVHRLTIAVAALMSFAVAHAATTQEQKKANFANEEATLQQESRSSASGSARVDKTVPPADPLPKATTKQQKQARFAQEEAAFQRNSRSTASGSPRVDKSVAAADPYPKATTAAEKKARFAEEEKRLQKEKP